MPTKYVQATIKVESREELTDEEAINVALQLDSITRYFPEGESASLIVYERTDPEELDELESDMQGERQAP